MMLQELRSFSILIQLQLLQNGLVCLQLELVALLSDSAELFYQQSSLKPLPLRQGRGVAICMGVVGVKSELLSEGVN